jgi:hypothetical protein
MRVSGHTSLDNLQGLPLTCRAKLSQFWVESVEEYLGLTSAVPQTLLGQAMGVGPEVVDACKRSGFALLSAGSAEPLTRPTRGGTLGCLLDPVELELFEVEGKFGARRDRPLRGFTGPLPSEVRLLDCLPLAKNQGERGTCVAFASVALREFLADSRPSLSEQFLYWACKELDGSPAPGTYIHTAMSALATYGTCRAQTWPYQLNQIAENESQGPPPSGAVEEARGYRMLDTRTVEPSLLEHYKHVLAGDHGIPGMPVVQATLVFESWYMSPETHRTGKITMPLPGERPLPVGHAWCVVGYVDDRSVPGGGYFIVRNSWGEQWACESPEAAGHALVPYAYVERYAVEAFTGPVGAADQVGTESHDELARYVRRLAQPMRDLEKRLLPVGTTALMNELAPGEVMEDTPTNRKSFIDGDCTWSRKTRSKVWFPAEGEASADFEDQVARAAASEQQFLAAIDENMATSKGQPFPEVNPPPLYALLPWEPHIREVSVCADLTTDLADALRAQSGVPEGVDWPGSWRTRFMEASSLRVYAVRGLWAEIDVVAGFVSAMKMVRDASPSFQSPDARTVERVRGVYDGWASRHRRKRPRFVFMTLGSPFGWHGELQGMAGGNYWVVCSSPGDDGKWQVMTPPRFADRLSLSNFLDRLKPETRQQRISAIKACVDDLLDSHYEGNVHLELIRKRTGYRRSVIREAMAAMRERGGYRVYRTTEGTLAVDRETGKRGVKVRLSPRFQQVVRNTAASVLTAAVTVTLSKVFQRLSLGTSIIVGICVGTAQVYALSIVSKHIAGRLKGPEE